MWIVNLYIQISITKITYFLIMKLFADEGEEEENGKYGCKFSRTEQNGCAVEYTGLVEGTSVTLVRVTISIKNKANTALCLLAHLIPTLF